MKKTVVSISVLCLVILIFYACKKNSTPEGPEPAGKMISAQQAKSWFDQQIKPMSNQAILGTAPNKHFTLPQWDKAMLITGANNVQYWKVPLASQDSARIFVQQHDGRTKKVSTTRLAAPSLLIYLDSTSTIKAMVMQLVPRAGGISHGSPVVNADKFSGEARLYDWTGKLQYGYVYENGKKQKAISPARKATPDANGRYEEVCMEFRRCLWGAACYHTTRPNTGYVFVSTVTTTEGGVMCYPPSDPPFSGDVGDWCDSWQNGGEEIYDECEVIWIEDPVIDPDPPPYESDDLTVGYGVENISNQITDPCQWTVTRDLMALRAQSEIVSLAHDIFGKSAKVNLTYKDKSAFFIDHPGLTFPDDVAGRTGVVTSGGKLNISIYLNTDLLGSASREYIAGTVLHELLHAILNDGTGSYEHNQMVDQYMTEEVALLKTMFPTLPKYDAEALIIEGLSDSILGGVLMNIFGSIWNGYVDTAHEYLNGTKGTSCY